MTTIPLRSRRDTPTLIPIESNNNNDITVIPFENNNGNERRNSQRTSIVEFQEPKKTNESKNVGGAILAPINTQMNIKSKKPNSFPERTDNLSAKDLKELKKSIVEEEKKSKAEELAIKKNEKEIEKEKLENKRKAQFISKIKSYGESFFGLKKLGKIENPRKYGNPIFKKSDWFVRVGTIEHLRCFDELIANRWGYKGVPGLKDFLDKTAKVVYNDLGINSYYKITPEDRPLEDFPNIEGDRIPRMSGGLIDIDQMAKDSKNYANGVMSILTGYPLIDKQHERIERGYETLTQDIYNKSQMSNPFLPSNFKDINNKISKGVCAPRRFDFSLNGKVYPDFLRNFNYYDPKATAVQVIGDSIILTKECTPPENMKYSWVPLEYRQDIYPEYNLNEYKYLDKQEFEKIYYNVAGPALVKNLTDVRPMDQDGHTYIVLKHEGKAYKVYSGKMKLNFPTCIDKYDKGLTLRDWCQIHYYNNNNDPQFYYRLLCILLNLPAPTKPIDKIFGDLSDYIYEQTIKSGNEKIVIKRMYMDAPLAAFQEAALQKYGISKSKNPTISLEDCMETFISNIYTACKELPTPDWPELATEMVGSGDKYYDTLQRLFEYGGNRGCNVYEAFTKAKTSKTLSKQAPKKPDVFITKEQVLKAPQLVFNDYVNNFSNYVKQVVTPNLQEK